MLAACDINALPIAALLKSSRCVVPGRIQTIVLFRLLGTLTLAALGGAPAMWTCLPAVLPVYVLRNACQTSCYALTRSLLMDYVPKVCTSVRVHTSLVAKRDMTCRRAVLRLLQTYTAAVRNREQYARSRFLQYQAYAKLTYCESSRVLAKSNLTTTTYAS